jgi:hypothetical protein
MFRGLICASSGGTVYKTIGFTPNLQTASRHNKHKNIPIFVYTAPPDDEQVSARNM